jgi:hypothetical protein
LNLSFSSLIQFWPLLSATNCVCGTLLYHTYMLNQGTTLFSWYTLKFQCTSRKTNPKCLISYNIQSLHRTRS